MDSETSGRVRSAKALQTAKRYYGEKAKRYRKDRCRQQKWAAEEKAIRQVMDDLPAGTKVLDIPCGDGRFFPFYHAKGFQFWGEDISEDMLAEARKSQPNGRNCCRRGDIFCIDHAEDAFDVTVTMRFMNLIKPQDVCIVLPELMRVAKDKVIFGWRDGDPDNSNYHDPHPFSIIQECLLDGWSVQSSQAMHQPTYLMVALSCVG